MGIRYTPHLVAYLSRSVSLELHVRRECDIECGSISLELHVRRERGVECRGVDSKTSSRYSHVAETQTTDIE